jgi:hypothetical protein
MFKKNFTYNYIVVKGMKKMKKRNIAILSVLLLVVLLFPLASAGIFDFLKSSGKAIDTFDVNISVTSGVPWIYDVFGYSVVNLNLGPGNTHFLINFSVNDSDGADNFNNATAALNLSLGSEVTRYNSSCWVYEYSGNHANISCNITMWWYDGDGNWEIGFNITDLNGNTGTNTTQLITVNTLDGFEMYPPDLTFTSLTPGTYNQTPANYLIMNNTGNIAYTSGLVDINASDLRGEDTPGYALWAGNFSASPYTGGAIECNGSSVSATELSNFTYASITNVVLNDGNYTINAGGTGQENMYLCLREVGSELSEQFYSTDNLGAWTVRVGT